MADIITDLKHFESILKREVISNYENSKDFVSGSFDEHIVNIVTFTGSGNKNMDYSRILRELKEEFAQPYDKRAVVSIDYDLLTRSSKSPINYDNIYVTTAFIIGEVFEYAEKSGTDVSELRAQFDTTIESVKQKMEDVDKYFIELDKVSYLCTKFRKTARTNEAKATVIFNQLKEFLENPNNLINKISYQSDFNYIMNSKLIDNIGSLATIKNAVISKIKEDRVSNNVLTLADTYALNQDNLSPIQQNVLDKNTTAKIEFTPSQKISGLILFSDKSVCYREQNGKYISATTHDEVAGKIRELHKSSIDYLLRKKPQIAKSFKQKLMENENAAFTVINTVNRFLENETLVKNYLKHEYDGFLRDLMTNKSVEAFDDQFTRIADKQKFQLFAYSIASNKYLHLYDDKSMELLNDIYNNNQDTVQLQNYVGKKIAAFKTPEEFNNHLTKYLSKINGFDPELILEHAEELLATVVSNQDDVIIIETEFYQQMSDLGSNSWCIVRDEGYYDDYAGNGNRQYIVFDFNQSSSSVESMIGITLSPDGTYRNAHLKDDESTDAENVEKFTDIIIMAQRETFPALDKDLEERLYPEVRKINKLKMA
jgi:hypothetical protein